MAMKLLAISYVSRHFHDFFSTSIRRGSGLWGKVVAIVNLANWIKTERRKRGWSQLDLAKKANVTSDTISRIELGKRIPQWGTIRTICELFGVPFEQVSGLLERAHEEGLKAGMRIVKASREQDARLDQNVEPYSETTVDEIPFFEADLAAGGWADVTEHAVCDPRQIDHGKFRVRLRGESMLPRYPDGQVVTFRCLRASREGPVVGRDYYVQRSDGSATFKRLGEIEEEMYVLRALNKKKFPRPLRVNRADVTRMAVAIEKVELLD